MLDAIFASSIKTIKNMSVMNNETKNEVKKHVATGASTAVGATAGVIIGSIVTPGSAAAAEVVTPEPGQVQVEQVHVVPETVEPAKPEPAKQEPGTSGTATPEPEVEVVGYDRIANEDGSQMDVAVLNVNGHEVGVIDTNLDGAADVLVCDVNQNGVIEQGEMQLVQGQDIAMQPLQDAAGFSPQFAQNNLPDYVNDADVDTYMA